MGDGGKAGKGLRVAMGDEMIDGAAHWMRHGEEGRTDKQAAKRGGEGGEKKREKEANSGEKTRKGSVGLCELR